MSDKAVALFLRRARTQNTCFQGDADYSRGTWVDLSVGRGGAEVSIKSPGLGFTYFGLKSGCFIAVRSDGFVDRRDITLCVLG